MSEPVLRTEDLTKRFGGLTAVDDLSFEPPGGRLHAIIGPNGAGKTTFFNLVSGLLAADERARLLSRAATSPALKPHQISRLGIKRTLQIKSVFPALRSRKISGSPRRRASASSSVPRRRRAIAPPPRGSMQRS